MTGAQPEHGMSAWARDRVSVWAAHLEPARRARLKRLAAHWWGRARPVWWGNVRRRRPFSDRYGADAGTPVDRVYVRSFLQENRPTGARRVLEVESTEWSAMLGLDSDGAVVDVLDLDPSNLATTVVADLCDPGALAPETYDCVMVMQTLQYVDRPEVAIANAFAALRPGGRLFLSAPVISRVDDMCGPEGDRWRWTEAGFDRLLAEAVGRAPRRVKAMGTLPAALAFLVGVSGERLRQRDLWPLDRRFPVVVCAWVDRR